MGGSRILDWGGATYWRAVGQSSMSGPKPFIMLAGWGGPWPLGPPPLDPPMAHSGFSIVTPLYCFLSMGGSRGGAKGPWPPPIRQHYKGFWPPYRRLTDRSSIRGPPQSKILDPPMLTRQVDEAVRISKLQPSSILNSKSEINHAPLNRILIKK